MQRTGLATGKIICEQAYAQGKMLNHDGWRDFLPRNITPSDIDAVFDDAERSRVVLVELSREFSTWNQVSKGQRTMYSQRVAAGCGRVFAMLCKHSVPSDRQIDTVSDIETFQVMRFAPQMGFATGWTNGGKLLVATKSGSELPQWMMRFYSGKPELDV